MSAMHGAVGRTDTKEFQHFTPPVKSVQWLLMSRLPETISLPEITKKDNHGPYISASRVIAGSRYFLCTLSIRAMAIKRGG